MNANLVVNPPIFATLPSCVLYLRGNQGTSIFNWSPSHATANLFGSATNSTGQTKFPPASIYFPGNSSSYLSFAASANWAFGTNWIGHAWTYHTVANTAPGLLAQTGSYVIGGGNTGYFYLYSSTSGGMNVYSTSPVTCAIGWHHWVFGQTAAGFNPILYLDGSAIPVSNNSSGNGGFFANAILYVGIDTYHSYYPTDYVDELAVWSAGGGVIPTAAQLNALTFRRLIV